MKPNTNHVWRLVSRPKGLLKESDFKWGAESIPDLGDGEILIRHIYLSLDPASRHFAREEETFVPPVDLGEVMLGIGIGVVEETRNDAFQPGDLVQGFLGWQEYAVSSGEGLTPLPRERPFPLTAYLAVFSHIGLAAYFGLLEVGKPGEGETLVVSAAAGAVGSLVGQIGKIKGCRVVGIAGSDEKCRWLKKDLGFDEAVNYKSQPIVKALEAACADGIDVYFDNVGGEILDAVFRFINMKARIVQCGMISQYNSDWNEPAPAFPHLINLHFKRARIEGFICLDYPEKTPAALQSMGQWLAEGKLKYRVEVIDGLENAPSAVNKNFDGTNTGKLICKVSEEP
jgi:NADPH-dependent curcumin reductase CurA